MDHARLLDVFLQTLPAVAVILGSVTPSARSLLRVVFLCSCFVRSSFVKEDNSGTVTSPVDRSRESTFTIYNGSNTTVTALS